MRCINLPMKHLLSLLFFFLNIIAISQVTVEVKPYDTIVCYRDSVAFVSFVSDAGSGKISWQWQKNLINISGATDSIYGFKHAKSIDTAVYRCIVSVDGAVADTSNGARLRMHPKMNIDTLYRYNPLGCPVDCKGQFKTLVSGGTPFANYPPYIYEWHGGKSQDTIVFGLCRGNYRLWVTDSIGCVYDTGYFVDALKSPKVDFTFSPRDTIYLTNPTITVAFADSMRKHITNWTWSFGDSAKIPNLNPASHLYDRSGQMRVKLSFTDINGCDTTYEHELTIKVAELLIPNIFTPNGDQWNEKFEIRLKDESETEDYRQAYLSNEFMVYDRWGRKVFNQSNFKSGDWNGDRLSDGTYYYILKCVGQWSDDVFRGSVTILRGSN